MAKMIPKQVRIGADAERFLKKRAREKGVTESEIVRRALSEAAKRAASDTRVEADEDLIVVDSCPSSPE